MDMCIFCSYITPTISKSLIECVLFDLCNVMMDRVLPAQHLSVNSNSLYLKKKFNYSDCSDVPLFRKGVIPTFPHFSVYSENSEFIKLVLPQSW